MKASVLRSLLVLALSALTVGCDTQAGTDSIIGGAAGAALGAGLGALVSPKSKGTGVIIGALIGGGVGAGAGGFIGHQADVPAANASRDAWGQSIYAAVPATSVAPVADSQTISISDVISWTQQGVRDDVIIDRIDRSQTVFHLTAADESQLRDGGVSEDVIRAMRDTARR